MFFEKNKAIITISANSIDVMSEEVSAQTLAIPEAVIANLEIVDKNSYSLLIKDFFDKLKLVGCEVIVLLRDDILYLKKFQKDDKSDNNLLLEKFKHYIPHDSIGAKFIEMNNEIHIYGVNKDLYSNLVLQLQGMQNTVLSVLPESLIAEQLNVLRTNTSEITNFFRNPVVKAFNFM